jgi:transcriptional regulator NrdR family protein
MADTVIKRDGHIVPFNKEKIYTAILKAMRYGSGIEKEKIANDIANEIEINEPMIISNLFSMRKEKKKCEKY